MNLGSWHLEWSPWGMTGALLLVAIGLWITPREWMRAGKDRIRRFLVLLRWVGIMLVAFTLLKPERVQRVSQAEKPRVHVLWDDSLSNRTRDQLDPFHPGEPPLTREGWIQSLLEASHWEPLQERFDIRFLPLSRIADAPAREDGTDLYGALHAQMQSTQNLRAVVLLSDGDWNTGKNPLSAASALGARKIPVFTLQAGADTHLPDVEASALQVPAYSMVGERVAASFRIQNHLPREVRTRVTLSTQEALLAERDIVIPAHGELSETLPFTPQEEGELRLRLEVPVQEGEVNPDNNAQEAQLSVRRETLKVLLIDTLPRWEIRYLRNALARDPGVELRTVLVHPQLGAARGEGYLPEIPARMEALQSFDVVFVGDIGMRKAEGATVRSEGFTDESAQLLRTLVEEQASGLVFLPGPEGHQRSLRDSPLADLMPVEVDADAAVSRASPAVAPALEGSPRDAEGHLELTLRGRSHWLTLLTADPASNESVWRTLPGFQWYAPVVRARTGSEVLAVHDSARTSHGRVPLLVTRNAGLGKVLYMGTDSAWRWRRGVEDTYHYRFWGQVVRWMAHQRHLSHAEGVRLFYTPQAPQQGDTVQVHATLLDTLGIPVGKAEARITLSSPGGARETLPLTAGSSTWGALSGAFKPREAGTYTLFLESPSTGRSLTTTLEVRASAVEKIGVPARSAVMREIALLSGGSWLSGEAVAALPEKLNLLPEHPAVETRLRLWCHPVWEGIILAVWLALWAGRKFRGLA